MFCRKCGIELAEDTAFCPACGTPTNDAPIPEETREYHRTMNELFHEAQGEDLRKAFIRRIFCFLVPLVFGGILGYICYSDEPLNAILMALALAPFFWVGYTCFMFCYRRLVMFVPILGAIISIVACIAALLLVSRVFSILPDFLFNAILIILIVVWYIWYIRGLKNDYNAWRSFGADEKKS